MRLQITTTCVLMVAALLSSASWALPGVRTLHPDEMLAVRGGHAEPCFVIQDLPCDPPSPYPCGSNDCEWYVPPKGVGRFRCPPYVTEQRANAYTFPGCVDKAGGPGQRQCNLDPDPANKTKCVAIFACLNCKWADLVLKCDGPFDFLAYLYIYNREFTSGDNCP
jgi:hypothetical protein